MKVTNSISSNIILAMSAGAALGIATAIALAHFGILGKTAEAFLNQKVSGALSHFFTNALKFTVHNKALHIAAVTTLFLGLVVATGALDYATQKEIERPRRPLQ